MKRFLILLIMGLTAAFAFAQSDDDLFFDDDDMFGEDTIEVVSDVSAKTDLSKGVIFDSGAVKVGGSLEAGLSTSTLLYSEEENSFQDNLYNTTLSPNLSAMLSVDARPTETLRIYTKFGFAYPFVDKATASLTMTPTPAVNISINNWFKLKECFTDFSIKDTAFFRFGVHTVTWGAGYFYSPVSDMINSSSIDPENPEAQVDGSLNLRTQIVFPNTQNCLWFYVIPSTNFTGQTAESYARDTALAAKADFLIGNWEFGIGGLYKYQTAPKAMLTATGSLKKVSFFGEFVYSYGAASEWVDKKDDWNNKTSIFQATAGLSYYWKEPKLTLAAQYYFESNDLDFDKKISQYGHNVAFMANKGDLFKVSDLSLSLFGMANFGHKEATINDIAENYPTVPATMRQAALEQIAGNVPTIYGTLTLNYSPVKELKLGMGPAIFVKDFETKPKVSFKLTASFGGGKF